MGEELSQEDQNILRQFQEGRQNLHSFFTNIVKSDDTTKTGNLDKDELGAPKLPLRTYKELATFCEDIAGEKEWGAYFNKIAENTTSTSLSKDGIFIKLAVTTKKELADVTPQKKENKGWFKNKGGEQQQMSV